MDKHTNKVVKSKSSNNAITTKSERKNIKSRSNAEFQPHVLKKRGVYVEKKSKLGINDSSKIQSNKLPKPPARPRPGKKRFLASVLTILTKTTTGTQYPNIGEEKTENEITKLKAKTKNKNKIEVIDNCNNYEVNVHRKKKFKSRVLNVKMDEQLVVLQSRKEIINTPSLYSEKSQDEPFKLSDLPRLVKDTEESSKNDLKKSIYSSIPASGIIKEILEGKNVLKQKKINVDNDPTTLVSEQPNKDEKGLYNFFVDLLETTFSVYNVKAKYNAAPYISGDISTSRIDLEIDETVAKKLNVVKDKEEIPEMFDDVTQKPSKHYYYIKNDAADYWNDQQLLEYFQIKPKTSMLKKCELPLKSPERRKLKTESFAKQMKQAPKTQSAVFTQRRSFSRKDKKNNLMSLLKEQLKMDTESYEEPQNLYEALKVIARNKRKCQKSTSSKIFTGDSDKCIFKRRKVISSSTKSNPKDNYRTREIPESKLFRSMRVIKNSEISSYSKKIHLKSECTKNSESESHHSLEVYGFDYEVEPVEKHAANQGKEIVFAYHSSPSISEHYFSPSRAILKYTDRDNSTIRKFPGSSHRSSIK